MRAMLQSFRSPGWRGRALLGLALALALLASPLALRPWLGAGTDPTPSQGEEGGGLCAGDEAFVVTACFNLPLAVNQQAQFAPAVVALTDRPPGPVEWTLANMAQVGTVWGLASAGPEAAVYAAAFHKRGYPFGPGGPGAIYRLDLRTNLATLLTRVPGAGPERHDLSFQDGGILDEAGRDWAGKTSLGDLEVDEAATTLFVMNLADRRIHRFALPGGEALGSFAHGAAGEAWAEDARPFALAFHAGRLYHGLVRSAEVTGNPADLTAHVYVSAPDGGGMREVLAMRLGYPRGVARLPGLIQGDPIEEAPLDWRPWRDGYQIVKPLTNAIYPQPLLADLAFDRAGNLLLGLRDRQADVTLGYQWRQGNTIEKPGLGIGDLILAHRQGERWVAELPTGGLGDPYRDRSTLADSSVVGGLAWLAEGDQLAAATVLLRDALGGIAASQAGSALTWFRNPDGNRVLRRDVACAAVLVPTPVPFAGMPPGLGPSLALAHSEWVPVADLGDVEEGRCAPPPTPTATDTPTDTPTPTDSPSPSPTATATDTPTASPTPTPTPTPGPIFLPTLLGETCTPERQHADVVLVLDSSSSMQFLTRAGRSKIEAAEDAARQFLALLDPEQDQAAVVWFNAGAGIAQPLTGDRAALDRALAGLRVQEYTRIHLGLAEAGRALAGPERRPKNAAVVILLTDGRSNPDPAQMAVDAAARLKAGGATLFTIGLGDDLDLWALSAMASDPLSFYRAADAEDLAAIYRQIARDLPCPAETFFPWRPGAARGGGRGR